MNTKQKYESLEITQLNAVKWNYNDRSALIFQGLVCTDGRREIVCLKYCTILQETYLTRYMSKMLQQDNATCHCSSYT